MQVPEGQLTRERLTAELLTVLPDPAATRFTSALLDLFDQDGNGQLSFSEYLRVPQAVF